MATHRWVHIDTVEDGTPVLALVTRNSRIRDRLFYRGRAYIRGAKVYVRTAATWWNSPGLRAHERTHLRQRRWQYTDELYTFVDDLVGHYLNPFEWHAYAVGGVAAIGGYIERLFR